MNKRRVLDPEGELSFLEHLDELRGRLIRMALYWVAGTGVGWYVREPLLTLLRRPAEMGAKLVGIEHLPFRIFDPVGGLMLALTIAATGGLILVSPAILAELWLFIRPALKRSERRFLAGMIPLATCFFLAGLAFSYWISTYVFQYIFYINKTMGVEGELTLTSYLSFIIKLLLATGLSFELPMVIMALAYVGIVKSEWMILRWRYLVMAIIILTVIFTPTNDPLTMSFFAIPLLLLFFLSIWMVKMVERGREKRLAREAAEEEAERDAEAAEQARAVAAGWQALPEPAGSVAAEPGSVEAEEEDPFSFYQTLAKGLPEPEPAVDMPASAAFPAPLPETPETPEKPEEAPTPPNEPEGE